MKKMMMAALAAGMMTMSAYATEGTVNEIEVVNDGSVRASLTLPDTSTTPRGDLVGTTDAVKAMTAVLLTAKSTGATVDLKYGTVAEGTGWYRAIIK